MAPQDSINWRQLILRGVESDELDYKAAQNWGELSRAGKAKFARHCLALANTKGGYIVVGVGEDQAGRPVEYTGLTEKQAKTWDPTDVGSFINRCADPPIDFDLEKPLIDDKQYVVFVVRRFSELPHVCVYSMNHELMQGAFYIRTKDASSRVAYKASEIHGLVQRALRNQRELLGRMLRGILYENRQTVDADDEQPFREQLNRSRTFFRHRQEDDPDRLWCEITAFPDAYVDQRFSLSDLLAAVEECSMTFRGWPFAAIGSPAETYFTNVSLRSCPTGSPVLWQIFQAGLMHHLTALPAPERTLHYQQLVWEVAEALYFCGQLYTALGCEEDLITVDFELDNVEETSLLLPQDDKVQTFICRIPTIHLRLTRSAADLVSGVAEHGARVVRELCERFNVPAGRHAALEQQISDHLQRS